MKVYEATERDIKRGEEHTILVGVMTSAEMEKLNDAGEANFSTDVLIRGLTHNEYGDDDFSYYTTERELKGKEVDTGWLDTKVTLTTLVQEYGEIDYRARLEEIYSYLTKTHRTEDDIETYGIDEFGMGAQLLVADLLYGYFKDIHPEFFEKENKQ